MHVHCTCTSEFLIYFEALVHHWPSDGTVNYDYTCIATNSINCLLFGSRCNPNGTHTNHFWTNLAHASKCIKYSVLKHGPNWLSVCAIGNTMYIKINCVVTGPMYNAKQEALQKWSTFTCTCTFISWGVCYVSCV